MTKHYTLSLLSVLLSTSLIAQTWTPVYTYNIQEFWDIPRVDASSSGIIAVSFQTIRANRALELSSDGGQTWNVVDADFQRSFIGFDSQDRMYMVSEKKQPSVSSTFIDSIYYSSDLGVTIQNLGDHPKYGFDRHSYYIDPQDNFYCLSNAVGPGLTQQLDMFNAGAFTGNILSGFVAGSSSLRSIIKLSNGNYVTSSYNDGIAYSTDGGQTWVESQGDQIIGATTFAIFAEANDGTLFLSGPQLIQCSDGGETWTASSLGLNFVNGVRRTSSGALYAAGEFAAVSIWESTDNGATWVGVQNQPAVGFYDWALSDSHIYVAFKDSVLYSTPVAAGGVGLGENSIQTSTVQVYPNPAEGDITIYNADYTGENWRVEIRNASGQLVHAANCFDHSFNLTRSQLPQQGLYIIKAFTSESVCIGETKLIKFK